MLSKSKNRNSNYTHATISHTYPDGFGCQTLLYRVFHRPLLTHGVGGEFSPADYTDLTLEETSLNGAWFDCPDGLSDIAGCGSFL